ncbi:MAG TPA: hypothetical protein VN948_19455 [Terriglobales bacterium]|nr:hypothetical protein [Terriglobales bacterium]
MTDDQIMDVVEQATRNLSRAIVYAAQTLRDANNRSKSVAEMLGEFLRDAGVLILVFVPVDILWPLFSKGQAIDPRLVKWTFGLSLGSLLAGMLVERWKDV